MSIWRINSCSSASQLHSNWLFSGRLQRTEMGGCYRYHEDWYKLLPWSSRLKSAMRSRRPLLTINYDVCSTKVTGNHWHPWKFGSKQVQLNTLASGKFEWNTRYVIFKQILVIDDLSEIVLIWMSLDFINDQSTLVQVMAWCDQATSHYLSQCWSRSLSPYSVTRPQWVNRHQCGCIWARN